MPVKEIRAVPRLQRRRSLLWRVFAANLFALIAAATTLALSPVTIHTPIRPNELVALILVFTAMGVLSFVLLQRSLEPLRRLASVIATIDPLRPGRRATSFDRATGEVGVLAAAFNEMLDRLETEQRHSVRRALEAQEGERLRVARELHDEIGQTLTAVALRAERAAAQGGDQTLALDEITAAVQLSLKDLRRISRRLRPEALDDLGLGNALIALCNRIGRQAEISIERAIDFDHMPRMTPEIELVVYRVAQEALTNVMRHARASRARVSLDAPDGRVTLTIADDGRGLSPDIPERTGVAGMRERALLVGGEFFIEPAEPVGVKVRLVLP